MFCKFMKIERTLKEKLWTQGLTTVSDNGALTMAEKAPPNKYYLCQLTITISWNWMKTMEQLRTQDLTTDFQRAVTLVERILS